MTKLPAAPTYFHKPVTALNAHRGAVVRPRGLQVAELRGRDRHRHRPHLPQRLARGGRRLHRRLHRRQRLRAARLPRHRRRLDAAGQGLRHPGPVGPGLVTDWDFRGKTLRTLVNGAVVQEASTDEMEWDMHYLVADIARTITLSPGDLLFSGTPANSRPVQPGDVVEVEVDGLGRLTNHVVTGPHPDPHRRGAQPTESEEVVSTALGGDWEFRGIRTPSRDLYPSTVETEG